MLAPLIHKDPKCIFCYEFKHIARHKMNAYTGTRSSPIGWAAMFSESSAKLNHRAKQSTGPLIWVRSGCGRRADAVVAAGGGCGDDARDHRC